MPEAIAQNLSVRGLEAWYGESKVLHGMDFDLRAGEVVTLLGRNGAGKTTAVKSIMGMIERRTGSIKFDGDETIAAPPYDIARKGVGYCPDHRGIFSSLSVRENLMLPPKLADGGMTVDDILSLFPNLKERLDSQGTKLSGGEQQMLALARVLRTGARILLLDEPTEGLAPIIIQQIARAVTTLKRLGFTILLIEQNVGFVSTLADRHYVVELGRVVEEIPAAELTNRESALIAYLGL